MATIRKRTAKSGDTSYIVQVKFTDKGSGKQIVRTATYKADSPMSPKQEERAAAAFADNFEKQIKESVSGSTVAENHNITFREFSAGWLEKVKRDSSLSYYVRCSKAIELVNQYIGGYKVKDITPAVIQNFYDKLDKLQKTTSRVAPKPEFRSVLESHGLRYTKLKNDYCVKTWTLINALEGKPISKKNSTEFAKKTKIPFEELFDETLLTEPYAYETIHQIKRTVRAVLSSAKKSRLIANNYASADYIDFPKRPAHKIEFMDDEQAKIFYKTVMGYPNIRYKTAMLLFLLTGFRRGEVAGLQWSDISFDNKTITISRSLTSVAGYGVVLKEPKTEKSSRTITVADTLITVLGEYREWWLQQRNELGDYMEENDYLFTQNNGKILYPGTFTGWMREMLKIAKLDHYSLHSLRHTNITMQIAAGIPIVTVAARAGHARPSTTSDIYAHFIKSSDKSAATAIDKVFNGDLSNQLIEENQKVAEDVLGNKISNDNLQDYQKTVKYSKQIQETMEKWGFKTYEEYMKQIEQIERKIKRLAREKDDYCL